MTPKSVFCLWIAACLCGSPLAAKPRLTEDKVETVVYAWTSPDYRREHLADGSPQPEYYAIANGGRAYGTASDATVDQVPYPEVAKVAMRLLATQGYRYGMTSADAKLLIVLHWGATNPYNRINYDISITTAAEALSAMQSWNGDTSALGLSDVPASAGDSMIARGRARAATRGSLEGAYFTALQRIWMENRVRDQTNDANAQILGYKDEFGEAFGLQQATGYGVKYSDLRDELEDPRYYIAISAYDFQEAVKHNNQKLLWVTRVSVSTRRTTFGDTMPAMFTSAARYFGRKSSGLVRTDEIKSRVDFGPLKVIGPVAAPKASSADVPPIPADPTAK